MVGRIIPGSLWISTVDAALTASSRTPATSASRPAWTPATTSRSTCSASSSPTTTTSRAAPAGATVTPRLVCLIRRWVRSCSPPGCCPTTRAWRSGWTRSMTLARTRIPASWVRSVPTPSSTTPAISTAGRPLVITFSGTQALAPGFCRLPRVQLRGTCIRHGLQPSSGEHHPVLVAELERLRVPLRVDRRQPG